MLGFVGNGDQKKFTKNPPHLSMQNSQANTKKIFTKFFWGAGKVTIRSGHIWMASAHGRANISRHSRSKPPVNKPQLRQRGSPKDSLSLWPNLVHQSAETSRGLAALTGGGGGQNIERVGGRVYGKSLSKWEAICQRWPLFFQDLRTGREETKGQFRQRVALASVPSFRIFVPGEHANVPSFRFSFPGNIRMYPRSGFRSEHPPKPPFKIPTLLATRENFKRGF